MYLTLYNWYAIVISSFVRYRTNLLLAYGFIILGIIIPLLQMLLAYIYFKKSHIWSRILNANLSDQILEGAVGNLNLRTLKYLVAKRIMH